MDRYITGRINLCFCRHKNVYVSRSSRDMNAWFITGHIILDICLHIEDSFIHLGDLVGLHQDPVHEGHQLSRLQVLCGHESIACINRT